MPRPIALTTNTLLQISIPDWYAATHNDLDKNHGARQSRYSPAIKYKRLRLKYGVFIFKEYGV
jgi:hypothetical protein